MLLSKDEMTIYSDCLQKPLHNTSTLVDILRQRAQNQPDQIAFRFLQNGETESLQLTYQEMDQKARAIAASLQSFLSPGERVLLLYPSGLEFIAAFFGCLYAATVAVPAYLPKRNQYIQRLQAIVGDTKTNVVLTTTSVIAKIESQVAKNPDLASLNWLATDDIATNAAQAWHEPVVHESTLAFLQYTSGSTGRPKGVMITHGNLMHNSSLIHRCFEHTPKSHGVIWLPPYHDMGLIGGIIQPLYGGFPVTLMSQLDFLQKPFRWLQAISHYKATTSGGPNFAYDLCIQKVTPEQRSCLDLSTWQVAFTGAEPIRAKTIEQFAEMFECCGFRKEAFYPCYGMAETTLMISGGLTASLPIVQKLKRFALEQNRVVTARNEEDVFTIVGCGQNLPDQQIVIVDPESFKECRSNEIGEIWVSGPSVADGYWNRPLETKQTFQAYLADDSDDDNNVGKVRQSLGPFLRTGDLGFLQNGELFITGRLKDVIIIRGQNYYPQDIELSVEKSHPALRPGCGAAFSIEMDGLERLVIVHEVERSYLRNLNVNEVVGNIRQAVAKQHELQVYATVLVKTGSIPKTSSGKIQRHTCRFEFLAGRLNVVEDWSENPKNKAKFMHLQAEIKSLLEKLQTCKQAN